MSTSGGLVLAGPGQSYKQDTKMNKYVIGAKEICSTIMDASPACFTC